ncbi:MAG: hypothetical protein LAP61_26125 [Acidobacteriia bacterium]|nr:hypothetical protein [Terriglobia bacterium]
MNRLLQAFQRSLAPAAGVLVLAAMTTVSAQAADCDRACLKGMITKYVDAMVAHDPARLPLAKSVRFTEDSQELKLSDGLWKTVTKKGDFRQDYIDLKKQIAASHVMLFEDNAQVLYSVVLRVVDQKITGIETLVDRITPTSRFKPDSLEKPLPGMSAPVPAGKRMPRADMIRAALLYPEGLRIGNFTEAKTPFAKEAYRVENGTFIAGEGGPRPNAPGLFTQKIMLHPDVKASVAAVDEEEGAVLLWMNFGDTNSYGPGNALVTFEAFKVWGGEIHAINAFFRILPKDTQRGWPSAE